MQNSFMLPALYCLLLPAIHSDLSTRTIPNWLTLTGCCSGLLLALWQHGGPGGLVALSSLLLTLAVAGVFWLSGWLGAGDVKLLAAVATLTGPALLPQVWLLTALSGLLLALVVMVWQGRTRHTLARLACLLGLRRFLKQDPDPAPAPPPVRLPYALAIASGSVLAALHSGAGLPA